MRTRREGEAELEVERASKEVGKMEAELEREGDTERVV